MSISAVVISRIIQGGATMPVTPPSQRDFKNTAIVWQGPRKGDQRINYVGSDISSIMDIYGSNSEVVKAARTFLAGGFLGNSPRELFVANIDSETTYSLAAGALTYVAANNSFKLDTAGNSALWTFLQEQAALNQLTSIDMAVNGQQITSAYLAVSNITDAEVQIYLTKGDFMTDPKTPVDFAAAPYSLTNNDATATGTVARDAFADAFAEILNDSTAYHLILDNTFTEDQKRLAISLCESSQTTHALYVLDDSHAAKYIAAGSDTTSLLAYAKANNYSKTLVVVEDDAPTDSQSTRPADEYKQASACSYYAQVNWTAASPMGSLAFKSMAGITASNFDNGGIINTTAAFDNVQAKNGNCYTNFTTVNDVSWYRGVAPNGNQFGDIIAKDYVLYQCDYNLFYMLRSLPKLPINQGGANRIESTMAIGLQRLNAAGVIGGGVADDGESFPSTGFKVFAEVPTGTAKAQGIWENVVAKALLTGTTTKITYNIQFKQ